MQDVENKAYLHFLWKNGKRGKVRERPTQARTTVFWKAFEVKEVMIWLAKRKAKADVNSSLFSLPNHDKALKGACPKG